MVNWSRIPKVLVISLSLVGVWWFTIPAQAAVNWSECRTEVITLSIPAGLTSQTVIPTQPVVDNTKAFVLITVSGTSGVSTGDRHMVSGYVDASGNVVFQRSSGTNSVEIAATIVECFNDEFSVQRGGITLPSGQVSNLATVSSVNVDRSVVILSSRTADSTSNESSGLVRGRLLSDTEVEITRGSAVTTYQTEVEYQVITFSEESGVIVYSNTTDIELSSGDTTRDSTLTTSVDPARTWVYCAWDAENTGLRQNSLGCQLEDESTVRFYRYAGGTNFYTNHLQYFAVEFPVNTITVQRNSMPNDPSDTDDTKFSMTNIINNIGNPNKAFAYATNTTLGTATSFPRNRWLSYLRNAVLIQFDFWRPSTGTQDANEQFWQVVRFPHNEAIGWGWIGNADDASYGASPGLISFNCDNLTGTYYSTYCEPGGRNDFSVQLESGGCGSACDVTGQAWVGAYFNTAGTPFTVGIIDFDPIIDVVSTPTVIGDNPATTEDDSLDAQWNEETGEVYGWARFLSLAAYEDTEHGGTADDWGWIKLRGEVENGTCTPTVDCDEYGVLFDTSPQKFSGWAWNGNGSDHSGGEISGSGFGWLKFDLSETVGGLLNPWLRTLQGDVFVNADIIASNLPPGNKFNATYLIQANGSITNFTSEYATLSSEFTEESSAGAITFPTDNTSQVYRGDIGSIHVGELIEQANEDGNAYGTSTTPVDCDESIFTGRTNPLAGQVFYCSGDLTISQNLTFYNGIGTELGSGAVVVGGDLIIRDNITYFGSGYNYIDHIANLASLAWIVEGSITIDSSVNELAGAYIALGDAGASSDFSTSAGSDPLTITGLVMARSFNFERSHVGTASTPEPAEDIVYDGRLNANPPPGLEDFSKTLPN